MVEGDLYCVISDGLRRGWGCGDSRDWVEVGGVVLDYMVIMILDD